MTSPRISSYLVRDHQELDTLLQRTMADPTTVDRVAYAAFRSGLLRHIAVEEKLLFPAARRAGVPEEALLELHIEHAAIASLFVPTPTIALCHELSSLLSVHNAKEEGELGVYALCEEALPHAESCALAVRAESFPSVRVARHFDGKRVYRTATSALAAARRIKLN